MYDEMQNNKNGSGNIAAMNSKSESSYNGSESDDDDQSTSTGLQDTRMSKTENQEVKTTSNEEKNVKRWRSILVLMLFLLGVGICIVTFFIVRTESSGDYERSYEQFANSIEATLVQEESNLHIGMRTLGETITFSASKATNFPFVLVDMFESQAENTRARAKMETVFFCPLIDKSLRTQWENWSFNNQNWITESRSIFVNHVEGPQLNYPPGNITSYIYQRRDGIYPEPSDQDHMFPVWYLSPPPFDPAVVNFDMASKLEFRSIMQHAVSARTAAISPIMSVERITTLMISNTDHLQFHRTFDNATNDGVGFDLPHVLYAQPVFAEPKSNFVVGALMGSIAWDSFLTSLVPDGAEGISAVVRSTCADNNTFTYELNGEEPIFLGMGDLHDKSYNNMVRRIPFLTTKDIESVDTNRLCSYFVDLYPSSTFEQAYASKVASIAAGTVGVTFAIVALIFCIYDHFVHARTRSITEAAARSSAVVNSLFPTAVRDRLLAADDDQPSKQGLTVMDSQHSSTSTNTKKSKPIADLFNDCTIMFADIAGFTAWSSMREPPQVFVLLETIYSQFDTIARRRRVFKVETIGDCYVAACGVPKPNKDHHVVMARFARDCLHSFEQMTRELEKQLGPDTGDLGLRIGLHSGHVTAGVLRGDRARFQLFGDSMNTAARIESNGESNKIHCSQETADLLVISGKGNWLVARKDKIYAKGKGELQTFWIENSRRRGTTDGGRSTGESENQSSNIDVDEVVEQTIGKVNHIQLSDKTLRLVDWNVDVLHRLLKQVVVRRRATLRQSKIKTANEFYFTQKVRMPIDEVAEIITLPEFHESHYHKEEDVENVVLDQAVTEQLHNFVIEVATLYNFNPFHNFEHASHVTMSVAKLLSRIVAPQDNMLENENVKSATTLHDHTYGITSDPLTQFSCVLSALIHDADHSGVPNSTLVKEGHAVAEKYHNKSVAEQNSVDLCWNTLMKDDYAELRHTIYETDAELQRFRQLLVNSVMATDIVDKELKNLRNVRWAAAFDEMSSNATGDDSRVAINRKATIVIEHLIQASDVAHTMQHWHIYRKWNERFFNECYAAYKMGRADADPSETWYKGELGFFDFYIIPLVKKLASCGVFGVTSDEYLNYATKNRMEWEARGQEVVSDMIAAAEKDWSEKL